MFNCMDQFVPLPLKVSNVLIDSINVLINITFYWVNIFIIFVYINVVVFLINKNYKNSYLIHLKLKYVYKNFNLYK